MKRGPLNIKVGTGHGCPKMNIGILTHGWHCETWVENHPVTFFNSLMGSGGYPRAQPLVNVLWWSSKNNSSMGLWMAGAGGVSCGPGDAQLEEKNLPLPHAHICYLPDCSLMPQRFEKNEAFCMEWEMFPLLPPILEGENLYSGQFLNWTLWDLK